MIVYDYVIIIPLSVDKVPKYADMILTLPKCATNQCEHSGLAIVGIPKSMIGLLKVAQRSNKKV
jgi:hypothetical protein